MEEVIGKIDTLKLEDDEWYDEVQILTTERFKTSRFTGDGWRTGVIVKIMRKGRVLYERNFSTIEYASRWLTWGLVETAEEAGALTSWKNFPKDRCDQVGCPEKAVVLYKIDKIYDSYGKLDEHRSNDKAMDQFKYRQFCSIHSTRGDYDMEDCDDNYKSISGSPEPVQDHRKREALTFAIDLRD